MPFNPNTTEGIIAIVFICVAFVLLVILFFTCIVCWCWRYKLHKRHTELMHKDAEYGIRTHRKGWRCCGCWLYCCQSCRGCCQPMDAPAAIVEPVVVQGASTTLPADNPYGWSKDVYAYNTGAPGISCNKPACGISSQPVNFNNRWSTANDNRLVLNAPGIASKMTPGVQSYGIYPSMPSGISATKQFVLNR